MKRLIILSALFILTACSGDGILGLAKSNHEIKYAVSGTATNVVIVYTDSDEKIQMDQVPKLPWKKKFKAKEGTWVYLRATMNGQEGEMTLSIFKNGLAIFFAKGNNKNTEIFLTGKI